MRVFLHLHILRVREATPRTGSRNHGHDHHINRVLRSRRDPQDVHLRGRRRYFHKFYALDAVLPNLGRPAKKALEQAMKGHVVAEARSIGAYQKGG